MIFIEIIIIIILILVVISHLMFLRVVLVLEGKFLPSLKVLRLIKTSMVSIKLKCYIIYTFSANK